MDKKSIEEFTTQRGITWKYSIERAPWYEGFWERMVRSVKKTLRKSLGTAASLNFEEFTTVLTEVETVVNSRLITYLNEDPSEPSQLTPYFLADCYLYHDHHRSKRVKTLLDGDIKKISYLDYGNGGRKNIF